MANLLFTPPSASWRRGYHEALTRLLQTSLFLVASPILVKLMFFYLRSSQIFSIQIFLCLPLLLFPSTCPCKAVIGSLSPAICMSKSQESPFLDRFYHCLMSPKLFSCFFTSDQISRLLLPMILLIQLISTTNILLSVSVTVSVYSALKCSLYSVMK